MGRYRCVFWGLFLCFFRMNLFGVEILPVSVALVIFTFGLYGLSAQTGSRHILLAARLSLANTLLHTGGACILMAADAFYRYMPSYPQYILFSLLNLFLLLTVWNLLAGMRAVFEPHREQPAVLGWIRSCGRGMIAVPILLVLPVLLYGVLMNLSFPNQGDMQRAMLAVICCNILPVFYSLYLITRYKRYRKLLETLTPADAADTDTGLPAAQTPAV